MIIRDVIYLINELDTQSGVVKQINQVSLENEDNFLENYQTRNILIDNLTGDTIEYGILTQKEYEEYLIYSGAITDLISLESQANDCLNRVDGNPEYIVVKGTTSGYINNLVISSIMTSQGDMDMGRIYSSDFDLLSISGVVLPRGFTDGFDEGFG
jgi:hypothetical protein